MLPKRAWVISGMAFLVIGFLAVLADFAITGYSIAEGDELIFRKIAGLWFVVAGVALLFLQEKVFVIAKKNKKVN